MSKLDRSLRKLAKLRRDPSRFFIDMLAKQRGVDPSQLNRVLGASRFGAIREEHGEHKVLLELTCNGADSTCRINRGSRLFDGNRGALMLLSDARGEERPPPLIERTLRDGKPGSFRTGRTEVIRVRYGPYASVWSVYGLLGDLGQSKILPHTWPVARLSGFLLVYNPRSCAGFLLARAWSKVRLITVLDEPVRDTDPLHELLPLSDVVVTYPAAEDAVRNHRYHVKLDADDELEKALLSIVQTLQPCSPDPFMPIIMKGEKALLDPSDSYEGYDAVARMHGSLDPATHDRFDAVLDDLVDQLDVFLLRSSFAGRYTTFVEEGDTRAVVKASVADGARVLFLPVENSGS